MPTKPPPSVAFSETLDRLMLETAQASSRAISEVRPFVCNGRPTMCDIFIVGTNPASSVSWSPFWDKESGVFDKRNWLQVYQKERAEHKKSKGKTRFRALSPTRNRIEIFVETVGGNNRVLETNLFAASTPAENDLRPADRIPLIFDFLLQTIKPKALFVHGETAASFFRGRYDIAVLGELSLVSFPHAVCPVIFAPHLAARMGLVTNDRVVSWAQKLKAAL